MAVEQQILNGPAAPSWYVAATRRSQEAPLLKERATVICFVAPTLEWKSEMGRKSWPGPGPCARSPSGVESATVTRGPHEWPPSRLVRDRIELPASRHAR